MIHFSHEKFKELMRIPENKKCFDCNNIPCQWASINNGIFLCSNCSGFHRGLGVENSYIRSILWDNWTEEQIEYMIKGGNKQLKDLLKIYTLDIKSINREKLYQTKIMEYYRNYLKSKVEGKLFSEFLPSEEEAFEDSCLNNNINDETKFASIGSSNLEENKENEISFQDNIKNWFGKVYKDTKDSINNLEIGNKLSSMGNSILETGNTIIDNENIHNFVKKSKDNLSYYFNLIIGNKKNNDENNKFQEEDNNNKNLFNAKNKNNILNNILNDEIKENNKNNNNVNYHISNK